MEEWMKIEDLCKYLQVTESWIRSRIKQNTIPFHNSHGILRFNRQEIDDWMKLPPAQPAIHSQPVELEDGGREDRRNTDEAVLFDQYIYRGKPVKDYILTANKILIGRTPWMRLPEFIRNSVRITKLVNREYLLRNEFGSSVPNFYDYLRVSCQLGLIEVESGREQDQRIKHYYLTTDAKQIASTDDLERIKLIIRDNILDVVGAQREIRPDEKHAILLLWLFLEIRNSGREPQEYDFAKVTDKPGNHFPRIRLNFARSLCHFLFDGDRDKEREFLTSWEQLTRDTHTIETL